jgi:hypothetical protein
MESSAPSRPFHRIRAAGRPLSLVCTRRSPTSRRAARARQWRRAWLSCHVSLRGPACCSRGTCRLAGGVVVGGCWHAYAFPFTAHGNICTYHERSGCRYASRAWRCLVARRRARSGFAAPAGVTLSNFYGGLTAAVITRWPSRHARQPTGGRPSTSLAVSLGSRPSPPPGPVVVPARRRRPRGLRVPGPTCSALARSGGVTCPAGRASSWRPRNEVWVQRASASGAGRQVSLSGASRPQARRHPPMVP